MSKLVKHEGAANTTATATQQPLTMGNGMPFGPRH